MDLNQIILKEKKDAAIHALIERLNFLFLNSDKELIIAINEVNKIAGKNLLLENKDDKSL